MAIESQGTEIQIGNAASPEVFTKIAKVVDFDGPDGAAAVIDVSTLDSTFREKIMGLPDEGQISMNLVFDPDDTSGQNAARTARTNRTRKSFRIVFNDDSPQTQADFSGYVLSFTVRGAVDDAIRNSMTIEIDGAVTWS